MPGGFKQVALEVEPAGFFCGQLGVDANCPFPAATHSVKGCERRTRQHQRSLLAQECAGKSLADRAVVGSVFEGKRPVTLGHGQFAIGFCTSGQHGPGQFAAGIGVQQAEGPVAAFMPAAQQPDGLEKAKVGGQVAGQALEDDANQRKGFFGATGGQVAVDEVVPVGELRFCCRRLTKTGLRHSDRCASSFCSSSIMTPCEAWG